MLTRAQKAFRAFAATVGCLAGIAGIAQYLGYGPHRFFSQKPAQVVAQQASPETTSAATTPTSASPTPTVSPTPLNTPTSTLTPGSETPEPASIEVEKKSETLVLINDYNAKTSSDIVGQEFSYNSFSSNSTGPYLRFYVFDGPRRRGRIDIPINEKNEGKAYYTSPKNEYFEMSIKEFDPADPKKVRIEVNRVE